MSHVKWLGVFVLLLGCGGLAADDECQAVDTIDFTAGFPKAGANKGEISSSVDWKGTQLGIEKVEVKLYITVTGQEQLLAEKTAGATISPGNWVHTFTGIRSGHVISRAYTRTIDVSGKTISEKSLPNLNVTVP